ncbi:2OG-Fe(II) oxygenase, partial [Sphingomonas sp.]|uniref:2OG-Fe(II) oxygenase n=1 Tax=Sphingomonas sp. TaxID=28214 RepID=UPI003B3A04AD
MTPFTLNPAIDVPALSAQFARDGVIQIDGFLGPAAPGFRDHLLARTDWNFVLNSNEQVYEVPRHGPNALPPDQEARLREAILVKARDGFQFCYDSIRVPDEDRERREDDPLHAFARFMSSAAVIDLLRAVTGRDAIDFADAQATAYRPGDFLTTHDDGVAGKHRHAAYVLSLSPDWRAEWGGLLLFHDGRGDILRG